MSSDDYWRDLNRPAAEVTDPADPLAALPRYGMGYDRNYMQVIERQDDGEYLRRDDILATLDAARASRDGPVFTFADSQRFYNAGYEAGRAAALLEAMESVGRLTVEDPADIGDRYVSLAGVTGVIEIAMSLAPAAPAGDIDNDEPENPDGEPPVIQRASRDGLRDIDAFLAAFEVRSELSREWRDGICYARMKLADAALATAAPALTGRDVHREWRDGMLAQGRDVAPERMTWETLDQRDRDLDDGIAARLAPAAPEPPAPDACDGEGPNGECTNPSCACRRIDTARLARALAPNFGPSYLPGLHDVTLFGESVEDVADTIIRLYAAAKDAER